MSKALLLLIVSVSTAAYEAVTYTNVAPDGVNKTYTTVDTHGYVVSQASTLVHVCTKYTACSELYDTNAVSAVRVYTIGTNRTNCIGLDLIDGIIKKIDGDDAE